MVEPRLLIGIPPSPDLDELLSQRLTNVPILRADEFRPVPWPTVRAALVGQIDAELPSLRPEHLPNLEFVQFLYTGVDDFPFDRFDPRVKIAGNGGAYGPFVAEHAVALILGLAKNLESSHEMVRVGRLRPVRPSLYLEGRRALILGFGAIGRETARRLRGLGLTIEAATRRGTPEHEADQVTPIAELATAIARADVIVNCLPLTRRTDRMIGAAELSRLKPDAIFVNVGRAGTVDEDALAAHLGSHPESRFGIDVWWDEDFIHGTVRTKLPLASSSNLLMTPHTAGVTASSRRRVLEFALENLARFFSGQEPGSVTVRDELPQKSPTR